MLQAASFLAFTTVGILWADRDLHAQRKPSNFNGAVINQRCSA